MLFRSLPIAAAFLCFAVGCAAPAQAEEEDVLSDESALTSVSLRSFTALDRVRSLPGETGSVAVDYVPSTEGNAYSTVRNLPFEAVSFEAASTRSTVAVSGEFPSSALVVVTNDRFEPIAASRTVRTATGASETSLMLPPGDGQRFILVRDPKWVRPMTFEVVVGR